MLNGATTRTVHLNVAAAMPDVSWTVTLISKLLGVAGVPERGIAEPVVADGVNGPVTVQRKGAMPPVTDSGKVNRMPDTIGCVGHVPVICRGATTVIEQVNTTDVRPIGSSNVTEKLYWPGVVGALPCTIVVAPLTADKFSPEFPGLICHENDPLPPTPVSGMLTAAPGRIGAVGHTPPIANVGKVMAIVHENVTGLDGISVLVSANVTVNEDG